MSVLVPTFQHRIDRRVLRQLRLKIFPSKLLFCEVRAFSVQVCETNVTKERVQIGKCCAHPNLNKAVTGGVDPEEQATPPRTICSIFDPRQWWHITCLIVGYNGVSPALLGSMPCTNSRQFSEENLSQSYQRVLSKRGQANASDASGQLTTHP